MTTNVPKREDQPSKLTLAATPSQARQTKQQFANSSTYLSFELGKAVQALPPLYTRLLAGTISLAVFGTIVWANFGKIDRVADATGKTVPSEQVQPIRAMSEGTILAIAREGQIVEKGDLLLRLDPGHLNIEVKTIKEQLRSLDADIRKIGKNAALGQDSLEKEIRAEIDGLERQLKLVDNELLLHPIPRKEGNDFLLSDKTRKIQNQKAILESSIASAKQRLKQVRMRDFPGKSGSLSQLGQLRQERLNLERQLNQAQSQLKNSTLKAPTTGTVFNVKVTKGQGSVRLGDEILSISPNGKPLVMKVNFKNKDRALIKPGMEVKVELSTFDDREAETIPGTVKEISPDSVEKEGQEPYFAATVELHKKSVNIQGKEHEIRAGMAGTAKIIIGKRTVLKALLAPVSKTVDEVASGM